jgi:hypothetical protein
MLSSFRLFLGLVAFHLHFGVGFVALPLSFCVKILKGSAFELSSEPVVAAGAVLFAWFGLSG